MQPEGYVKVLLPAAVQIDSHQAQEKLFKHISHRMVMYDTNSSSRESIRSIFTTFDAKISGTDGYYYDYIRIYVYLKR